MKIIKTHSYSKFLYDLKNRIREAQISALKSINKELILLYWDIGKAIIEKQNQEKWGSSVIENLAKDLQSEFPGIKGFSSRNLWLMRDLYESYKSNKKMQTLSAEISWSHNTAILQKCNVILNVSFIYACHENVGGVIACY